MTNISWTQLNFLDYAILAVIAISIIISFLRGFIKEAVSLAIWVAAFILAIKLAPPLANHLQSYIHSPSLRFGICFIIIFIIVLILGIFINVVIAALVDKSGINLIDRLVGVIFGAARGILVVAILLLLITFGGQQPIPWVKQSQLAPQFQGLVNWLGGFLPQQIQQVSEWVTDTSQSKADNTENP